MTKSYRTKNFFEGLRFSCSETLKTNKKKFVLTFVLVFVAIFTGVFVAIKSNNNNSLGQLQEIDLSGFYNGFVASSGAFVSRSLSLLINVLLLVVLSLSKFLFPLAEVLFVYRGYLFGLNFTLILIFYGIGGIITAVVVVLPLQLLSLFVLVVFFVVLSKCNRDCRRYGRGDCNRSVLAVGVLLVLLVLNLLETVFLIVLNGKVILVI